MVIAWAKRERAEGDGSCWKVGTHPHTINGRFDHLVALFEGNWWEESGVSQEDRFLKVKVVTKVRYLCLLNIAIHIGHENDLVAI